MASNSFQRAYSRPVLFSTLLLLVAFVLPTLVGAEGSGSLYPINSPSAFRANIEWRTSVYGSADSPEFNIFRRTLIKVYAEQGEHLLMGSSAVGVGSGDIRIYRPGIVTGAIGSEDVPALSGPVGVTQPGVFANGFSCERQRRDSGAVDLGRIRSRTAELAGPNSTNNLRPEGYTPCVYTVAQTGIYDVIFLGPAGANSNLEPRLSGAINPSAADFGEAQRTSVSAWDISVRRDLNSLSTESGRAFTYYVAGNTGGGGRNVIAESVVVTDFGFRYRVRYNGDPWGFVVYSNQFGFIKTNGSPLYRNIMADPLASTQDQNQLRELQGEVQLLPPKYPLFFSDPYGPALDALKIPREPIVPAIASLTFVGSAGDNSSLVGAGGTFSFQTSQPGVYSLVISRDRVDFTPDNPRNKLIQGIIESPGPARIAWDGRDNSGELFPVGEYTTRAIIQGGEVHFPFLDVENNTLGGPTVELLNPPDVNNDNIPDCPPWIGGCFGAFYNDSGYRTTAGTLIGTAVGGPLCVGDAFNPRGFGEPPLEIKSNQLFGFDTRTTQRSFGFPFDANPERICHPLGGFGDKKALDLWTYYPSNQLLAPLRIFDPTAVTLRSFNATAGAEGVTVRWETGSEIGTAGFHLLRAAGTDRLAAIRVTPQLILARGSTTEGAVYSWLDTTAAPGQRYSYWLEEHETDGRRNEYGPVGVGPSLENGPHRVLLPLVQK